MNLHCCKNTRNDNLIDFSRHNGVVIRAALLKLMTTLVRQTFFEPKLRRINRSDGKIHVRAEAVSLIGVHYEAQFTLKQLHLSLVNLLPLEFGGGEGGRGGG